MKKTRESLLWLGGTCAILGTAGIILSSGAGTPAPNEAEGKPVAKVATADPEGLSIEIAFVTHLDANLPEQDVYIQREPDSGEVYRVTVGDHDMTAPLYATATRTPHNPFDPEKIGPHAKGEPLGFTLGQWLKHRGTGTYTYKDGVGTLDLSFSGLVPNGVYTLWHAFLPAVPPEPFTGTHSIFHWEPPTDRRACSEQTKTERRSLFTPSNPAWRCRMSGRLRSWQSTITATARATAGHPGDFGLNSHIPLFAMLPKRGGIE